MKCQNKDLAEDLVQDTCTKAYQYFINSENIIENPKAWLTRILLNTHIDYVRKKQLETVDIADVDVTDYKTPADEVESNMFFKDLNTVLKDLTPDQREIIHLKDINEYSYKEISDILNIPIGTVMSRLHKARQKLRNLLVERGYSTEGKKVSNIK